MFLGNGDGVSRKDDFSSCRTLLEPPNDEGSGIMDC